MKNLLGLGITLINIRKLKNSLLIFTTVSIKTLTKKKKTAKSELLNFFTRSFSANCRSALTSEPCLFDVTDTAWLSVVIGMLQWFAVGLFSKYTRM